MEWGAEHPGAADASAFYQSRVHAFTAFALDAVLGPEEAATRDSGFGAGLDFLHGLQGPDGIKTAGVEAKPWYWRSAYEVASHPFDVAAFAAEWRRTRAPRAASALAASCAGVARAPRTRRPPCEPRPPPQGAGSNSTRSYQCAFFWAAHASWMARSLPEIEEALAADQARLPGRSAAYVTSRAPTSRGSTRRASPRGCAGPGLPGARSTAALRAVSCVFTIARRVRTSSRRRRSRADRSVRGAARPGSFAPRRGWRAGRDELRFSLWLARNRRRTDGVLAAAREPVRALRDAVIAPASTAVSTAFDRQSSLEVTTSGVIRWTAQLADRTGRRVGGEVDHELRATDEGQLELRAVRRGPLPARGAAFRLPAQGQGEVEGDTATVRFGDSRG